MTEKGSPLPIEGLWEPSGPLRPVPPAQTLPARFGRYILKERIGVGGMAEVFLASQDGPAGFSKSVVVKRILPHLAEDAAFVQMFQREANVAAALNHVNVVAINELGVVDGQYFIAMEHVDGVTLHRLARRAWRAGRSLPTELVVGAIADAALGLHHAHQAKDKDGEPLGLVHRDVSPENLMINRDGVTKVLDFGIARGSTGALKTGTGELKGKIPFLAPEQVADEPLDGRADLYALGVTMYWLLTGHRPFQGTSELLLLNAKLQETPKPPSAQNPAVPKVLDDVVMKLLERAPSARYENGLALHDALQSMAPARTQLAAPFVREVMELPAPDDPTDVGMDGSEGFVPSTPVTDRFGEPTAQTHVVRKAPGSRRTLLAASAGLAGAIVVGAALFAFLGDEQPPPVAAPAVAAAPEPTPTPTPAPPPTTTPEPPPPVVAPPSTPPEPVETVDDPPVDPRKTMRVALKAPSSITWQTVRGKSLGRGNASAEVPAGTRAVIAVDGRTKARTQVAVKSGVADYASIERGTLDVRALPYAEVWLGDEKLGLTPFPAKQLPAGSYKVRLVYEGKEERRTVDVKPGRTERLLIDFRAKK